MVIAHKALALLQEKGFKGLAEFAAMLDDPAKGEFYQQCMNIGSVGPDLYYAETYGPFPAVSSTNRFLPARDERT
jgi:hypothetical protein